MINFSDYQRKAVTTAVYPKTYNVSYPALGLAEEAGEVAGKIAKMMRDNISIVDQRKRLKRRWAMSFGCWPPSPMTVG